MSKAALKPRILIVDDNERLGRLLKPFVEKLFNCQVCFPPNISKLQDATLNEAFDSILVDANLSDWKRPFLIFGERVSNGIDFARVYSKFHEKSLIVILGPENL